RERERQNRLAHVEVLEQLARELARRRLVDGNLTEEERAALGEIAQAGLMGHVPHVAHDLGELLLADELVVLASPRADEVHAYPRADALVLVRELAHGQEERLGVEHGLDVAGEREVEVPRVQQRLAS